MKLYAVRDRLIGYFLQPFPAHTDKDVLASCANAINREDNRDPIAQTPHHFEIWKLAEINDETGKVTGDPELLADCSSLVRGGIRETHGQDARADQSGKRLGTRPTQPEHPPGHPGANGSPPAGAQGAETLATPGTHQKPGGIPPN